jgi:hypothetical protein
MPPTHPEQRAKNHLSDHAMAADGVAGDFHRRADARSRG